MKSLYLRIYLTVVTVLLAFAFGSAWLFQGQIEQERGNFEAASSERFVAMGVLLHRALPPANAPRELQAEELREWSQRLRMPMAMDDSRGERIATSASFERRVDTPGVRLQRVVLDDGRELVFLRGNRPPQGMRPEGLGGSGPPRAWGEGRPGPEGPWPGLGLMRPGGGTTLVVLLVLLFLGVAIGAYPVVRRLTRRLENLKTGVEEFGAGHLSHRVDAGGKDEVAALAHSFNQAADRIEGLVNSHKSLLANASHELRSPLARLKMAFSMLEDSGPEQRARLQKEIHTNIGELDALVDEVLLASRLESGGQPPRLENVDLVPLAAEESARVSAELRADEPALALPGDERLLRRALRNLLENARRYGGGQILLELKREGHWAELRVCDRGPGVPEAMRERIFEAFFRLPGHAEVSGGVGLGLNLVKQIAQLHKGSVRCEGREGGGSCFVLRLPLTA
ncbi:HAMP domain-containing histidine kinase [Pelomonas sp. CA6]|uniref:sensor histidine kinase n=1 Tax=Pelomonas sp. CA6 TaxID=2907999 RepID=UPI001F4BDA45|nr:HAMP domain-containing sensor histidine kinase [Pelomonas sp. CA6]MCH7345720.1 HAMP domain-containing histidine kinase [Pelomonas sp. CA6]